MRVYCTTCRRPKLPRGRDPGPAAANGYCDRGCEGYEQEPLPGHLWPSEELPAPGEKDTP